MAPDRATEAASIRRGGRVTEGARDAPALARGATSRGVHSRRKQLRALVAENRQPYFDFSHAYSRLRVALLR
jgi:hypothetical protein